jgi:cobalt-zinc-cadmium efflux system outer membrane protein
VDELMSRADTSRGELTAFSLELAGADFSERAAERGWIPEPEVVAGTKSSNDVGGDVGTVFAIHVALPLFDRAGPERAAARARALQVRADADLLRQTIRTRITSWRAAVVERRAIAERHGADLARRGDQIERIAQVSYEAGERGILELLDAYRTTSAARLRQVELDAAVRQAEIELEFVSGWEIP